MFRRVSSFVFLLMLVVAATFAQNNRSAVSLTGSDANSCTTASPCRSFGVAMTNTNAGGEIIALDSAGYGPFSIIQSVTVSGAPGVHAAITVVSGNGITITLGASDRVVLRNLVLIGNGGGFGIFATGGEVRIAGLTFRGFSQEGIQVLHGNVTLDRVAVIDNTVGLLLVGDVSGLARATITDSLFQGNEDGIDVAEHTAAVISDSTITGNSFVGVSAGAANGMPPASADVVIERCTIAYNNVGVSVLATGGGFTASITLSQNVFAYNGTGVQRAVAGTTPSFGNNRFVGNVTDGGPFTAAVFQ